MSLRLVTLGQLSVFRDGVEETSILSWRRRLALLTYVGVEREVTRDQLTALLWPEKDPDRARHSLSQAVYEIRQACGSDCLLSRGEWVQASPDLVVDAADFRSRAESGDHHQALKHYGGPFLSGVHLAGTPEFEHWVEQTQARLRRLHRVSRDAVIREHLVHERMDAALSVARRWVELEPLEDEAQHHFIQLLARSGRRSEALQQYETFERALAQQDLEPLDETRSLVEGIRTGEETGSLTTLPSPPAPPEESPAGREARASPPEAVEGPEDQEVTPPRKPFEELVQALKERWVFRVALTYAAALFVWIQVGDALMGVFAISQIAILRVTTLGLAALPALVGLTWALEPWLRSRQTLNGDGSHRDPTIPFHLTPGWRGLGAAFAVAGSAALGIALWPDGQQDRTLAAEPALTARRHGFAIIPIQPEDTTDAFLASVSGYLTRTLINYFRDFDVLNVPSAERISVYSGHRPPPDSIIENLGVELLLTGWLGARGDSILVSLDLESPGLSGDHIETMVPRNGSLDELELVERVSGQINTRLRLKLGAEFRSRELRLGTQSPEAWTLVREGEDERARAVDLINRADLSGAEKALSAADSLFRQAGELDPEWPEPLFLRGSLTRHRSVLPRIAEGVDPDSPLAMSQEDVPRLLRQGVGWIEEGLRLDPTSREGLYAKAEVLRSLSVNLDDPDSLQALNRKIEDALQQAIRGDPPRPDAMLRLAHLQLQKGEYETALDLLESAFERDVFRQRLPSDLLELGRLRLEAGLDSLGLEECGTAEAGATGWDRYMLHECQLLMMAFGRGLDPNLQRAESLINDSTIHGVPMGGSGASPNPRLLTLYAGVLARTGFPDSARSVQEHVNLLRAENPIVTEYDVGVLALLGDTARAFQILRGRPDFHLNSVIFDPLRRYPAFDSLEVLDSY